MNRNQRALTMIALLFFVATLIYTPWISRSVSGKVIGTLYQPIWDPPSGGTLAYHNLFIEWIAIGVVYGGVWAMTKHPHPTHPPRSD